MNDETSHLACLSDTAAGDGLNRTTGCAAAAAENSFLSREVVEVTSLAVVY